MRTKPILLTLLLNTLVFIRASAQEIPLVYDVENTGANYPKPVLPTLNELPIVEPLTDPFEWSDGSGRDTSFASWSHRRAEIGAEFEHYEIGPKPARPDTMTASYDNDTLTVNITVNGNTLTLTSIFTLPEGAGPFPAVIGMGGPTGSLPADIFTTRKIATIPFNFGQVMAWSQTRGKEPINRLYPDLAYMGAYDAWSWGVSRLIDGLELVQDVLPIDLKHLAVTGCSFAGKMALFAGALDERIALTIPQESGGGGAAAWRVSETLNSVETLKATSQVWFMTDMFQFSGKNVPRLPMDHHELMAMVAPRALFVIGNPDMVWLADTSGYVSSRAAKRVWETFGVPDRMGFSFVRHPDHCVLPDVQKPEVEAFVEKFLLGDTTVNTDDISTNPYPGVDYSYWTEWWGTGDPSFPTRDRGESENIWFEAECATVGASWNVELDTLASNGGYVKVKDGLKSTSKIPADIAGHISFPFTATKDTTFYVFGRVNSLPTANDGFWLKMDDGNAMNVTPLSSNGWQWKKLAKIDLTTGEHTLIIAYRLGAAKLDKVCVSDFSYPPGEMGEEAQNLCVSGIEESKAVDSYTLSQNYPNPFNPSTEISYKLPEQRYVTLKVYDVAGREVMTLVNEKKPAGTYRVNFNAVGLGSGVYFYQLKAGSFTEKKKMMVVK